MARAHPQQGTRQLPLPGLRSASMIALLLAVVPLLEAMALTAGSERVLFLVMYAFVVTLLGGMLAILLRRIHESEPISTNGAVLTVAFLMMAVPNGLAFASFLLGRGELAAWAHTLNPALSGACWLLVGVFATRDRRALGVLGDLLAVTALIGGGATLLDPLLSQAGILAGEQHRALALTGVAARMVASLFLAMAALRIRSLSRGQDLTAKAAAKSTKGRGPTAAGRVATASAAKTHASSRTGPKPRTGGQSRSAKRKRSGGIDPPLEPAWAATLSENERRTHKNTPAPGSKAKGGPRQDKTRKPTPRKLKPYPGYPGYVQCPHCRGAIAKSVQRCDHCGKRVSG